MTPVIRTAEPDDFAGLMRCTQTAFLNPERDSEAAWVRYWRDVMKPDPARTWGAFDGGVAVGTLRSVPFELTVPGTATVPAAGITMVTVSATHRRRGLLTGMMAAELDAAAARGDAAAVLIASEWPIYGRYGYGPATEATSWEIDRRAARCPAPVGALEQVDKAELRTLAEPVYDRARRQRAGGLDRPQPRWDRDLGLSHPEGEPPDWSGRAVVHRDPAGEVDGYLRWHSAWEHGPRVELTVDELIAATDAAYADLWRFALSVDLVTHVVAGERRADEALPWLLPDGRAARQTARADKLWLRPLDVPALLTARTYDRAGRVVLDVLDPHGRAGGRFALDATPQGATCAPTTESADLTLPVTTLASAYLGGHRLRALALGGGVDEHRPGALAVADRLLGTDQAPHCTLHF